jgi:hypothetical protein
VGQNKYNVWKFKVTNLLLKEDLLDLFEADTTTTSGQKEQHTKKKKNKALTIINLFVIDKIMPCI